MTHSVHVRTLHENARMHDNMFLLSIFTNGELSTFEKCPGWFVMASVFIKYSKKTYKIKLKEITQFNVWDLTPRACVLYGLYL